MMAQAAIALSVSLDVFTDDADEATAALLPHHGLDGGDPSSWLGLVDVVTFEHELLALDRVRDGDSRPGGAPVGRGHVAVEQGDAAAHVG